MRLAVIPARYASTRFPGKPLVILAGKPLIQHVWERTCRAQRVDRVIIATDDERILRASAEFGAEAIMTSPDCASGSDRVAEVARKFSPEIVVNVQGDEPLIDPRAIDSAISPLEADPTLKMSSLMRPLGLGEAENPNVVKVVCDRDSNALYFSRSPIPYLRDPGSAPTAPFRWGHVGLYCFRADYLLQYNAVVPTPLEKAEKLEQLRILETGGSIRMVKTDYRAIGVDTPEDAQRVEPLLAAQPE